jgi:hypothetical protein
MHTIYLICYIYPVLQDYNPFEEDPGTAPFSEPEAQIMQELSKSFKPHIWVNVHSGMEVFCCAAMPYFEASFIIFHEDGWA